MMFFYLSTCSTCIRIMKELNLEKVQTQDLKSEAISLEQVERMAKLAGSYQALFNKRAMKYRALGLHEKELSEEELKALILKEYTFLKRPVLLLNDTIFVGNSKKVVEAMKQALNTI